MAGGTHTLTQLIDILEPLNSDDRLRNINAALTFLGESKRAVHARGSASSSDPADHPDDSGDHIAPPVAGRAKKYGLTDAQIEPVYDFREDSTFTILDVPGTSMRDQAINMYILTGLGTFLATGERKFTDELARANCQAHGCLDQKNHATTLGSKHPEFGGDKKNGWTVTVPGLKRGAELVRQVADRPTK